MKNKSHYPRRHFSKAMFNPYFHSDHYINESKAGKIENKIELFFKKIKLWTKK